MTPTITAPIQVKLTEDEFNDGYKMYKRLKGLLQPSGAWHENIINYKDVSEFLDHVKWRPNRRYECWDDPR